MSKRVDEKLAAATTEELAALASGAGMWGASRVERLGLPGLRLSDGPSGVRGPRFDGPRSACFPCGSALGATWDVALVERVGRALGDEARRKGAHVLLAPTVTLQRHPLAGRTFESFSEDPHLTARLGVAYVRGVQAEGVAAAVKHFAVNDQEHGRMAVSVEVDERALRELHLAPFEAVVREADVRCVMAAYNRLEGVHCTEHRWLLTDVLRGEWGFRGCVLSDWFATRSTAPSAEAGLDLEMPGPAKWYGSKLAAAAAAGEVRTETLERMARATLDLAEWTGALDGRGNGEPGTADLPEHRALARETAAASFVLLRNEGALLPLDRGALRRVAVVGAPAELGWAQGGGSVEVLPHPVVTPLEGLRRALDGHADVAFERGPFEHRYVPDLDGSALSEGSVAITYFAGDALEGEPVLRASAPRLRSTWVGRWTDALDTGRFSARLEGTLVVEESGDYTLGLACTGRSRVRLDGATVLDAWKDRPRGASFFGFGSAQERATVHLEAGRRYALAVEFASSGIPTPQGVALGLAKPNPPDALAKAVAAAREADVVVVVVGTGPEFDVEGTDRTDLSLPSGQAALVEAIAAANPRTVVCVNAGAPVSLSGLGGAAALLYCWLPGEEWGNALADVLLGVAEPGGRLPMTLPERLEDTPAFSSYPGTGDVVRYDEGLLVGYRWYDTRAVQPAHPFGAGTGYTAFEYRDLRVTSDRRVSFQLANVGERSGSEVVQVYMHARADAVGRPEQELRAFAKVTLAPGESRTCDLELDERAFSAFVDGAWRELPGTYEVRVGASSRDVRLRAELRRPGLGRDATTLDQASDRGFREATRLERRQARRHGLRSRAHRGVVHRAAAGALERVAGELVERHLSAHPERVHALAHEVLRTEGRRHDHGRAGPEAPADDAPPAVRHDDAGARDHGVVRGEAVDERHVGRHAGRPPVQLARRDHDVERRARERGDRALEREHTARVPRRGAGDEHRLRVDAVREALRVLRGGVREGADELGVGRRGDAVEAGRGDHEVQLVRKGRGVKLRREVLGGDVEPPADLPERERAVDRPTPQPRRHAAKGEVREEERHPLGVEREGRVGSQAHVRTPVGLRSVGRAERERVGDDDVGAHLARRPPHLEGHALHDGGEVTAEHELAVPLREEGVDGGSSNDPREPLGERCRRGERAPEHGSEPEGRGLLGRHERRAGALRGGPLGLGSEHEDLVAELSHHPGEGHHGGDMATGIARDEQDPKGRHRG